MPDIFIDHQEQPEKPITIENKRSETFAKPHSPRAHKLGILSSFVRDPLGVALAEQHEDEHILVFIRRAFVTNIPWLFLTLVLLIAPFFFSTFFAPLHVATIFFTPLTLIILTIFYYLVVLGYAFGNFLTWFYDIGIVTEKRAVDIDFYNISFVSVATARAQDLKDVRYVQKGFFESLFDYGDVTLVVEASGETLTFEKTPHPAEIVSILSALIGGHQA